MSENGEIYTAGKNFTLPPAQIPPLLKHSEKVSFQLKKSPLEQGKMITRTIMVNRLFLGLYGTKVVKYEDASGFVFIFVT